MHSLSVNDLELLIQKNKSEGEKFTQILIGYKLFAEFMNVKSFHDEVVNSALSPTKRKYKNMKVKITTEEYQLDFS